MGREQTGVAFAHEYRYRMVGVSLAGVSLVITCFGQIRPACTQTKTTHFSCCKIERKRGDRYGADVVKP